MTWKHMPRGDNDNYTIGDVWGWANVLKKDGGWFAELVLGQSFINHVYWFGDRLFPSAEEAMTAVEERLASFAQDLLSDVLGKRRIQEAKHES